MPPGVPKERVQVIRAAFDETMKDPAFRAAIEKRHLTLDPVSGAEMTAILEKAYSAPPAVIDAARKTMASQ